MNNFDAFNSEGFHFEILAKKLKNAFYYFLCFFLPKILMWWFRTVPDNNHLGFNILIF